VLTTEGRLLGGRVIYSQPESGFRSGIEPILLAAATPARPGERVLEGGTGAGAALLCLHARVPDVCSVGIEIDASMAELAGRNAAANGFAGMAVLAGGVESVDPGGDFDHAIANPPYHPLDGTASQSPAREVA
jgi:tRNA1Val (adenine37-N6)-methyltransferase